MSILVTGGAGFIGSHLVQRMADMGEHVVCLDNLDDYYDPSIKRSHLRSFDGKRNITVVHGDIRDPAILDEIGRNYAVDSIIHAAARAGVRPSIAKPQLYIDVNVRGTGALFEFARAHHVRMFVFLSSSSVYGVTSKAPFSEEDPVERPISPYAATKKAGELLGYTYHHLYGLPVTCLRLFTVYGARQRPDMAIHRFTQKIHRGEPLQLFGDGSSARDYTYIDDIINGIVRAWQTPLGYEVLNLGESQTITLRELITLLEENLGRKARVEQLPDQPGDVPLTNADISKARRMIGYNPTTPVRDGIRSFVQWYLSQAR